MAVTNQPVNIPRSRAARPLRWLLLPVLLLFAALLGLLGGYSLLARSDYIFNGVKIDGVAVGNMTRTEAAAAMQQRWQGRQAVLVYGDERRALPQTALGVQLLVGPTVEQAYRQGRQGNRLSALLQTLTLDVDIALQLIVDWQAAGQTLDFWADEIARSPQPPTLAVVDGVATAVPGLPGIAVDRAATLAAWQANWRAHSEQRSFPLMITEVGSDVDSIEPFVSEANRRLQQPLTLSGFDAVRGETVTVTLDRASWAQLLQFEIVDGALRQRANEAQLASVLTEFAERTNLRLGHQAGETIAAAVAGNLAQVDMRLFHPPTTHVVASGETLASIGRAYGMPYPWIQAANPGVAALAVGQTIVIPSPDELIPLEPVRHKRIIVSISEQRMWAYENGSLRWEWPVSTGISESPTAPGIFQIQSHESNAYAAIWDLYMPNFMGIYQPAPNIDFMNGFHGFPTRDGVNLLWTNSLGKPATYGCILVSNDNMGQLYSWAEAGTIVEVRQ